MNGIQIKFDDFVEMCIGFGLSMYNIHKTISIRMKFKCNCFMSLMFSYFVRKS